MWKHSGYTPNYFRVETLSIENLANEIRTTHIAGVGNITFDNAIKDDSLIKNKDLKPLATGQAVLRGA